MPSKYKANVGYFIVRGDLDQPKSGQKHFYKYCMSPTGNNEKK
jgi:hypothetical protein